MCTVFAYSGSAIGLPQIRAILERTRRRGPDSEQVLRLENGFVLAFQRLSIMGVDKRGMQPFEYKGMYSVTNGEIYGFRSIRRALEKEGYSFHSDSDCETVLYLYEKYGEKMFPLLDAEYATVIYDKDKGLFAARDPIGIRPLFYGYDRDGNIAFEKLIAAVEKRLDADTPVAFLLSGGLDSSLVCSIATRILERPIRTFSIGMEKDPIDSKYAEHTASFLNAIHTNVTMSAEDVIKALPEVINALATYDITTIRASMGMYLLCRYIHEKTDVRVLLTGEVSDELFGYKYTDFAPDADVLTNPNNTAIGVRSFGSDPDMTAQMVEQAVKGFQDHQVSAVIKHFPGHGGTTTDSHNGAAIVDRSLEELRSAEFLPFEAGIQAGVDMVMVGHLQVPQVISDDTPASLSSEMITDVLRNELGYDGIVITDSLSMGAITTYYTSADAAVKCIQAGGDMLLMPYSFTEAYQGVLDAVNSGEISEDRINESVTRILKVKCKNLY